MNTGLTAQQRIVEVAIRNAVLKSPKAQIDAALAELPEHRIVSLALTSTEEFNTAAIALVVVEFL